MRRRLVDAVGRCLAGIAAIVLVLQPATGWLGAAAAQAGATAGRSTAPTPGGAAAPVAQDTGQAVGSVSLPGILADVAVAGGMAYVAAGSAGLRVVDVSQPAAPHEVSNRPIGDARRVVTTRTAAFVVDNGPSDSDGPAFVDDLLRVFDIGTPSEPAAGARYNLLGETADLAYSEPLLFAAVTRESPSPHGGWYGQTWVEDVTWPNRAKSVSSIDPPAEKLAVVGRQAYLTRTKPAGGPSVTTELRVIDLLDPYRPVERGTVTFGGGTDALAAGGGYVYAATKEGLTIVSVREPSNPRVVARLPQYAHSHAIGTAGGCVYLGQAGFIVLDLRDPATPVELRRYPIPVTAFDVVGNYAYTVTDDNALAIFGAERCAPQALYLPDLLDQTSMP